MTILTFAISRVLLPDASGGVFCQVFVDIICSLLICPLFTEYDEKSCYFFQLTSCFLCDSFWSKTGKKVSLFFSVFLSFLETYLLTRFFYQRCNSLVDFFLVEICALSFLFHGFLKIKIFIHLEMVVRNEESVMKITPLPSWQ